MKRQGLSLPVLVSSVRPTMRVASAMSTPETNTFRPVSSQSSPSRRAVVVMRWELEPASGSVMPKAMVRVPSARPGSHCCFWRSVPKRAMTVPQIAGETIIMRSGDPAAPNSSRTMESSTIPPPPPPYSSGRLTPR